MQQVNRMVRRQAKRAFTLVEILIVVVILGILAAIVVPQFTDAATQARGGNVATQETTIETQLELFAARNSGAYPSVAELNTDAANGPAGAGWGPLIDGDYLKDVPMNPFSNTSDVVAFGDDTTTPEDISDAAEAADPADGAWLYNVDNGLIRAARNPS